mgnify:CR=1 FL=1
MPNLSQKKRDRMLTFLKMLKDENKTNDEVLIAIGEIESELTSKKYGLVWEEHQENVDLQLLDNIPVFSEVPEKEISAIKMEIIIFCWKVTIYIHYICLKKHILKGLM